VYLVEFTDRDKECMASMGYSKDLSLRCVAFQPSQNAAATTASSQHITPKLEASSKSKGVANRRLAQLNAAAATAPTVINILPLEKSAYRHNQPSLASIC
jgi:hypothetical protein